MVFPLNNKHIRKISTSMTRFVLLLLPGLLAFLPSTAQTLQSQETGLPFIKNYHSKEYNAHTQNFDISQDNRGIMYFGNFAGVLIFDGIHWDLIPTKKITKISSLVTGESGIVYVGAHGEFGYLSPDSVGSLKFVSLNESISEKNQNFTDVAHTLSTDSGIYFITENIIFKYNSENIESYPFNDRIISAYYLNDSIYIQLEKDGLVIFNDSVTIPVPGGSIFRGGFELKALLSFNNEMLLVSSTNGLYIGNSDTIRKFYTQADYLLEANYITSGIILNDNSIALGTVSNGIIILDDQGLIKQIINRNSGLKNQYIQNLYADKSNNLWAALNNGISLIEIPSPLNYFNEKTGLDGGVTDIIRHNGILWVSTYQGLFYYDNKNSAFKKIPSITFACWDILSDKNTILAATSEGVYRIVRFKPERISKDFTLFMIQSQMNPSTLYCGRTNGLYTVTFGSKQEKECFKIKGSEGNVNNIVEDSIGNIWYSTISKGIFRYKPETGNIIHFDESRGIPSVQGNILNKINNEILLTTKNGILKYSEDKSCFMPYKLFDNDTGFNGDWYGKIVHGPDDNIWVTQGDETNITLFKTEKNNFYQTPFLPISDFIVKAICFNRNGVVFFGGPDGLIKYNPNVNKDYSYISPAIITSVFLKDGSLVFGGFQNLHQKNKLNSDIQNVFSHRNNTLIFNFSLPTYNAKEERYFQYYLEGFDDVWSEWTTISHKEYTNLSKDEYVFHVRGKDLYNQISDEDTFQFRVLSPWYATIWAFIIYIIIISLIIYQIIRWRSRRLIKEKQILEDKIAQRTKEIVKQKDEIEEKSAELAAKNEELEKINIVVKSINSEIQISKLMQTLLDKTRMIRSVERSTVLVWDKENNSYRYKASVGWDLSSLSKLRLSLEQANKIYLAGANEVFKDIYINNNFSFIEEVPLLNEMESPQSVLVLVIKFEDKVDGFLILENMNRYNAFGERDLNFVRNLKEHIVSAFIKSKILEDLQTTLNNLKDAQTQLVQSEKLASLGELTAGIAHEIQNPLNFVNNFSNLSEEMADELKEIVKDIQGKIDEDTYDDILDVVETIESNAKKINEHGHRAESIVKGMLQHSRGRSGEFQETDINNIVKEYLNLAYHGMRAKDKSFNVKIETELDPDIGRINVVPQDFSRAVLNIVNNACYAVHEKSKKLSDNYKPEIFISTKKLNGNIEIKVKDNGTGIPKKIIDKIFNPFFTTKPTGKGTGLGLSMTYDIITKIHKGKLEVNSKENEFTEFIIKIPVTTGK